ncbi:MAG: flagellar motor protein MotB [Phycisphaerales bacterium]
MRSATAEASRAPRCLVAAAGLTVLMAAGCVPQDRYDALLTANRSLQERVTSAEADRDSTLRDLDTSRGGLSQIEQENMNLQSRVQRLDGELANVAARNEEYIRQISSLDMGSLPANVTRALSDLANRQPDLLSFDAGTGMVRFASDLTFDLGSDSVKSSADTAIATVARVLNSTDANGLQVEVVGHTDNVPISRAATRAKHPTNMHLSVHRAIAVRSALVKAGVASNRIKVAGFGEYLPVQANASRGGNPANRRVEIFISEREAPAAPAAAAPARSVATPARSAPAPARPTQPDYEK